MSYKISKFVAKALMQLWPSIPDKNDMSLQEIFNLDEYTCATPEEQDRIRLLSAQYRYDYETHHCFFKKYFPMISRQELYGKSILDLGCFTGGRIIKWVERYGFGEAKGIDIKEDFIEAARAFSKKKGVDIDFQVSVAENLPYPANHFDYVISNDVFEHVCDVKKSLEECFRVLKSNGRLLAVFPPFLQPLESHLGLVTGMPALQWFFSGETLFEAYREIIKERGNNAYWYSVGFNQGLREWERLPSLNGITVKKFRRIVAKNKSWHLEFFGRQPFLAIGRTSNKFIFRLLNKVFIIPARLPLLEELFLGRICCILKKSF